MWSPLGDELNDKARWVPEPNTRGTYGIISSCVLTLVLCLWTVQRPGVSRHQASRKMLPTKIFWLLVALFTPDMFAGVAFYELREAQQLTKDMQEALGSLNPRPKTADLAWHTRLFRRVQEILHLRAKKPEPEEINPKQRKYQWTMKHSYFTIMGGFSFDNSDGPDQCPMPFETNHIVLGSKAMLLLAKLEPDLIPDISQEEIDDRSKTNSLSTLLVCIQALWFCLQTIVRMSQSLAITLLELSTFSHAVCALIVYGFWWHKPMDINHGTTIPVAERAGSPRNAKIRRAAALCQALCVGCPYGRFSCWAEGRNEQTSPSASEGNIGRDSELYPSYNATSWTGLFPTEKTWKETNDLHSYPYDIVPQKNKIAPVGIYRDNASWIMARFEAKVREQEQRRAVGSGIASDVSGRPAPGSAKTARTGTPVPPQSGAQDISNASAAPSSPSTPPGETISQDGYCAVKIEPLEFGFNGDGFVCTATLIMSISNYDKIPLPFWWLMAPIVITIPAKYLSRPQRLVDDLVEYLSVEELRMILEAGPGLDYCDKAHTWGNILACKQKHVVETSLIQPHKQNGLTMSLMNSSISQSYASGFVVSVSGLLYSVFHIFVWEGPFRTNTEKVLWRFATAYIACSSILTAISYLWVLLDSAQKDRTEAFRRYIQHVAMSIQRAKAQKELERSRVHEDCGFFIRINFSYLWLLILCAILPHISFAAFVWQNGIVFLACRLLLIVESIISLAYVPDSVFELPNWSIYFPHLT